MKDILKKINLRKNLAMTIFVFAFLYLIDSFNLISVLRGYLTYDILIVLILIAIGMIVQTKLYRFVTLKSFSEFDSSLVVLILSLMIYYFISNHFEFINFGKSLNQYLKYPILLVLVCLFIRTGYITLNIKKTFFISVIDLGDFIKDNHSIPKGKPIFFSEQDVEYDLLNRQVVIKTIIRVISNLKNTSSFVISLSGKWGSGKTTIINNVKEYFSKSKSTIIIDDLDLWKYNDEEKLLYIIFLRILKVINLDNSFSSYHWFKVMFNGLLEKQINLKFSLDSSLVMTEEIVGVKRIIEKELEQKDVRVVIVLDNLERVDSEKILILLKAISTVLKIDRIIYILLYDEEELKQIFDSKFKINFDYINKIVQLPLKLPIVEKDQLENISMEVIHKLTNHYSFEISEEALKLFSNSIYDLRELKRKVNSIFSYLDFSNKTINQSDLLLLELIKYDNYLLYTSIFNNPGYFISEDRIFIENYYQYIFNPTDFNRSAKEFFEFIFSKEENKQFLPILCELFPYVKIWKNKQDRPEFIPTERTIISEESKNLRRKSIIDHKVFNARFFGLFFSQSTNIFSDIDSSADAFIDSLNLNPSISENDIRLKDVILKKDYSWQTYYFENLEFKRHKLKNQLSLIHALVISLDYIDQNSEAFMISPFSRSAIICSEIVFELDETDYTELLRFFGLRVKDIGFINNILYWIDSKDHDSTRMNDFSVLKSKLSNRIIESNIDVYSDEYYRRGNIFAINDFNIEKLNISVDSLSKYFRMIIDNIISGASTDGYLYRINRETIEKYTNFEMLEKFHNELDKKTLTSEQTLVYDLLSKFIAHKSENEDNYTITLKSKIDFGSFN